VDPIKFVSQPNAVMKPEFPTIDQDKMVSPHAQEVEFALILSRMINTVKEDPVQLRLSIYEFARAKLQIDTSWAEEAERERFSAALETAIQGVEQFSARRDEKERLQPPTPSPQIALGASAAEPPATSMVTIHQVSSAPKSVVWKEAYSRPEAEAMAQAQTRVLLSTLARFGIGILLFGTVAGLAIYSQRTSMLGTSARAPSPATLVAKPPVPDPAQPGPVTGAVTQGALPFPLPTDYGVYALNDDKLSELNLLPEQVPDKRIAMSTPINQSSRTTLPDGKARFVVFRRDLVGSAPDRIEVRVVARVVRALTFDAKGKASFTPVSDAWNIRNLSHEFRVRPIAGNPEMLMVQAENPDFVLPAGRYVLALKNQGYDFTVAGKVTDPSQCLERTDAANGTFYSDCQKP
jgi:hypothetical protein